MTKIDTLVIAAHPDDEILGCGGAIRKRIVQGEKVGICLLSEGVMSRSHLSAEEIQRLKKELHDQSEKVKELLGASWVIHNNFPDNQFDTLSLLKMIKVIENIISESSPHTVFTHCVHDLNIDHQLTHKAVLTACRPTQQSGVKNVFAFETLSSTEWNFSSQTEGFRPNYFVDISSTLAIKREAMRVYDGEIRPFPHPRSSKGIEITAQKWGMTVGCDAAEAFELIYHRD